MKPRLVVKVGTSTLLSHQDEPTSATFARVARSLKQLRQKYEVLLVTSGAIGFGVRQVGVASRPSEVHQLQALSMIGQVGLLRRWREAFDDVSVGQVLVTRDDLERSKTVGLFRDSVHAVWDYGAIPIVNENDAVSTEEISFGDNDRLAAEVAVALEAETLVILTDQDGIQAEFGSDNQRRLESVSIDEVDEHIQVVKSTMGTGGASSKVVAARIALQAGVAVYIAHAGREQSVEDALAGKVGTKIVQ